METTGRMLRLLSYLRARPPWSGREPAQRLEVTERTLRRDIARLRSLGYPVEATPGRYGGYRLTSGGALAPLLPDDDEVVAVAWGLRAAAGGALPGFEDPALAGAGQDRAGAPPIAYGSGSRSRPMPRCGWGALLRWRVGSTSGRRWRLPGPVADRSGCGSPIVTVPDGRLNGRWSLINWSIPPAAGTCSPGTGIGRTGAVYGSTGSRR